jgi:hypothetical protein
MPLPEFINKTPVTKNQKKTTKTIFYQYTKHRIMKKCKWLLLAVAAIATVFATSCKKSNPKIEFEDGIYLIGDAIGFANPEDKARFYIGQNEAAVPKQIDPRINEKYAWLEAGKTFRIGIVEAGKFSKIGGDASSHQANVEHSASGAKYFTPKKDGTFSCTETGLYHVIYYTGNPENLIVITKVDFGIRGELNSWGFTSLGAPIKVEGGVNYRLENFPARPCIFKLAYNSGWKLPLVFVGDVMVNAETSLGGTMNTLVPGGGNIELTADPAIYTVTLEWRVGATHGFSKLAFTRTGTYYPDPAEWVVGFSGSAVGSWEAPEGDRLAEYSADLSSVTNATTKEGIYVFTISELEFIAGKAFKFRCDGGWFGWDKFTITGDIPNFSEDSEDENIAVAETKTYKIKITLEYSGSAITSKTVDFTEL